MDKIIHSLKSDTYPSDESRFEAASKKAMAQKYSVEDVDKIGKLYEEEFGTKDTSELYGIQEGHIRSFTNTDPALGKTSNMNIRLKQEDFGDKVMSDNIIKVGMSDMLTKPVISSNFVNLFNSHEIVRYLLTKPSHQIKDEEIQALFAHFFYIFSDQNPKNALYNKSLLQDSIMNIRYKFLNNVYENVKRSDISRELLAHLTGQRKGTKSEVLELITALSSKMDNRTPIEFGGRVRQDAAGIKVPPIPMDVAPAYGHRQADLNNSISFVLKQYISDLLNENTGLLYQLLRKNDDYYIQHAEDIKMLMDFIKEITTSERLERDMEHRPFGSLSSPLHAKVYRKLRPLMDSSDELIRSLVKTILSVTEALVANFDNYMSSDIHEAIASVNNVPLSSEVRRLRGSIKERLSRVGIDRPADERIREKNVEYLQSLNEYVNEFSSSLDTFATHVEDDKGGELKAVKDHLQSILRVQANLEYIVKRIDELAKTKGVQQNAAELSQLLMSPSTLVYAIRPLVGSGMSSSEDNAKLAIRNFIQTLGSFEDKRGEGSEVISNILEKTLSYLNTEASSTANLSSDLSSLTDTESKLESIRVASEQVSLSQPEMFSKYNDMVSTQMEFFARAFIKTEAHKVVASAKAPANAVDYDLKRDLPLKNVSTNMLKDPSMETVFHANKLIEKLGINNAPAAGGHLDKHLVHFRLEEAFVTAPNNANNPVSHHYFFADEPLHSDVIAELIAFNVKVTQHLQVVNQQGQPPVLVKDDKLGATLATLQAEFATLKPETVAILLSLLENTGTVTPAIRSALSDKLVSKVSGSLLSIHRNVTNLKVVLSKHNSASTQAVKKFTASATVNAPANLFKLSDDEIKELNPLAAIPTQATSSSLSELHKAVTRVIIAVRQMMSDQDKSMFFSSLRVRKPVLFFNKTNAVDICSALSVTDIGNITLYDISSLFVELDSIQQRLDHKAKTLQNNEIDVEYAKTALRLFALLSILYENSVYAPVKHLQGQDYKIFDTFASMAHQIGYNSDKRFVDRKCPILSLLSSKCIRDKVDPKKVKAMHAAQIPITLTEDHKEPDKNGPKYGVSVRALKAGADTVLQVRDLGAYRSSTNNTAFIRITNILDTFNTVKKFSSSSISKVSEYFEADDNQEDGIITVISSTISSGTKMPLSTAKSLLLNLLTIKFINVITFIAGRVVSNIDKSIIINNPRTDYSMLKLSSNLQPLFSGSPHVIKENILMYVRMMLLAESGFVFLKGDREIQIPVYLSEFSRIAPEFTRINDIAYKRIVSGSPYSTSDISELVAAINILINKNNKHTDIPKKYSIAYNSAILRTITYLHGKNTKLDTSLKNMSLKDPLDDTGIIYRGGSSVLPLSSSLSLTPFSMNTLLLSNTSTHDTGTLARNSLHDKIASSFNAISKKVDDMIMSIQTFGISDVNARDSLVETRIATFIGRNPGDISMSELTEFINSLYREDYSELENERASSDGAVYSLLHMLKIVYKVFNTLENYIKKANTSELTNKEWFEFLRLLFVLGPKYISVGVSTKNIKSYDRNSAQQLTVNHSLLDELLATTASAIGQSGISPKIQKLVTAEYNIINEGYIKRYQSGKVAGSISTSKLPANSLRILELILIHHFIDHLASIVHLYNKSSNNEEVHSTLQKIVSDNGLTNLLQATPYSVSGVTSFADIFTKEYLPQFSLPSNVINSYRTIIESARTARPVISGVSDSSGHESIPLILNKATHLKQFVALFLKLKEVDMKGKNVTHIYYDNKTPSSHISVLDYSTTTAQDELENLQNNVMIVNNHNIPAGADALEYAGSSTIHSLLNKKNSKDLVIDNLRSYTNSIKAGTPIIKNLVCYLDTLATFIKSISHKSAMSSEFSALELVVKKFHEKVDKIHTELDKIFKEMQAQKRDSTRDFKNKRDELVKHLEGFTDYLAENIYKFDIVEEYYASIIGAEIKDIQNQAATTAKPAVQKSLKNVIDSMLSKLENTPMLYQGRQNGVYKQGALSAIIDALLSFAPLQVLKRIVFKSRISELNFYTFTANGSESEEVSLEDILQPLGVAEFSQIQTGNNIIDVPRKIKDILENAIEIYKKVVIDKSEAILSVSKSNKNKAGFGILGQDDTFYANIVSLSAAELENVQIVDIQSSHIVSELEILSLYSKMLRLSERYIANSGNDQDNLIYEEIKSICKRLYLNKNVSFILSTILLAAVNKGHTTERLNTFNRVVNNNNNPFTVITNFDNMVNLNINDENIGNVMHIVAELLHTNNGIFVHAMDVNGDEQGVRSTLSLLYPFVMLLKIVKQMHDPPLQGQDVVDKEEMYVNIIDTGEKIRPNMYYNAQNVDQYKLARPNPPDTQKDYVYKGAKVDKYLVAYTYLLSKVSSPYVKNPRTLKESLSDIDLAMSRVLTQGTDGQHDVFKAAFGLMLEHIYTLLPMKNVSKLAKLSHIKISGILSQHNDGTAYLTHPIINAYQAVLDKSRGVEEKNLHLGMDISSKTIYKLCTSGIPVSLLLAMLALDKNEGARAIYLQALYEYGVEEAALIAKEEQELMKDEFKGDADIEAYISAVEKEISSAVLVNSQHYLSSRASVEAVDLSKDLSDLAEALRCRKKPNVSKLQFFTSDVDLDKEKTAICHGKAVMNKQNTRIVSVKGNDVVDAAYSYSIFKYKVDSGKSSSMEKALELKKFADKYLSEKMVLDDVTFKTLNIMKKRTHTAYSRMASVYKNMDFFVFMTNYIKTVDDEAYKKQYSYYLTKYKSIDIADGSPVKVKTEFMDSEEIKKQVLRLTKRDTPVHLGNTVLSERNFSLYGGGDIVELMQIYLQAYHELTGEKISFEKLLKLSKCDTASSKRFLTYVESFRIPDAPVDLSEVMYKYLSPVDDFYGISGLATVLEHKGLYKDMAVPALLCLFKSALFFVNMSVAFLVALSSPSNKLSYDISSVLNARSISRLARVVHANKKQTSVVVSDIVKGLAPAEKSQLVNSVLRADVLHPSTKKIVPTAILNHMYTTPIRYLRKDSVQVLSDLAYLSVDIQSTKDLEVHSSYADNKQPQMTFAGNSRQRESENPLNVGESLSLQRHEIARKQLAEGKITQGDFDLIVSDLRQETPKKTIVDMGKQVTNSYVSQFINANVDSPYTGQLLSAVRDITSVVEHKLIDHVTTSHDFVTNLGPAITRNSTTLYRLVEAISKNRSTTLPRSLVGSSENSFYNTFMLMNSIVLAGRFDQQMIRKSITSRSTGSAGIIINNALRSLSDVLSLIAVDTNSVTQVIDVGEMRADALVPGSSFTYDYNKIITELDITSNYTLSDIIIKRRLLSARISPVNLIYLSNLNDLGYNLVNPYLSDKHPIFYKFNTYVRAFKNYQRLIDIDGRDASTIDFTPSKAIVYFYDVMSKAIKSLVARQPDHILNQTNRTSLITGINNLLGPSP